MKKSMRCKQRKTDENLNFPWHIDGRIVKGNVYVFRHAERFSMYCQQRFDGNDNVLKHFDR